MKRNYSDPLQTVKNVADTRNMVWQVLKAYLLIAMLVLAIYGIAALVTHQTDYHASQASEAIELNTTRATVQ